MNRERWRGSAGLIILAWASKKKGERSVFFWRLIALLVFGFTTFPAEAGPKNYDLGLLLGQPHPWMEREHSAGNQARAQHTVSQKSQVEISEVTTRQNIAQRSARAKGNFVGIEVSTVPDYEGSNEYAGAIGPLVMYRFSGQRYIALLNNKIYLNIANHRSWEFGPMAVYRRGRDSGDIDDPVVKLLSDVDDSIELGAFFSYREIYNRDLRHRMKITLSAAQDVSDGHDGLVASLSGVYWTPVSKIFDIGLSGGVEYASDNYMSRFYGINSTESLASGLPSFTAEEGIKDVSFSVLAAAHLSPNWQIRARITYKILLGDAADSPVVDIRGDDNQYSAGLSVLYSW